MSTQYSYKGGLEKMMRSKARGQAEEIPAKPYGSYTHSIVDAKPLGEGCRALLKHSAHACAAHKAHASHVAEGDDDIE